MSVKGKTVIFGLTGSMGAGKSTVAAMMKKRGAAVFSADLFVRTLWKKNKTLKKFIQTKIPEAKRSGQVDYTAIANRFFSDKKLWDEAEKRIHPLVKREARTFIQKEKRRGRVLVVLEIPLLFEAGFDKLCTETCCVCAPLEQRKARVLARAGATARGFETIKKRQWSEAKKRQKADWIIHTESTLANTEKQTISIINQLVNKEIAR